MSVDKFWVRTANCLFCSEFVALMCCYSDVCGFCVRVKKELLQAFVCRSSIDFECAYCLSSSHHIGRSDLHIFRGCFCVCHHCCFCIDLHVCRRVCCRNIFGRCYCTFCCRYNSYHHYNIEVHGNLHLILHILRCES